MSSPKQVWILAFWLVIQVSSSTSTDFTSHSTEGDFAFDVNDDFQSDISHKTDDQCPVRKLWGVPDMPAYVGRVFKLQIPNEAFSGKISGYKASGMESSLPSWLTLDSSKGLLRGIPDEKDLGEHRLIVTALPFSNYSTKCPIATDTFTIEVKDVNESPNFGSNVMEQCHLGEDETHLIIVIDRPLQQLSTKQKLYAINKLAVFMGLDQNAFLIRSHELKHDKPEHDVVIMSGLGDKKKKNHKSSTEIVITVGCSGKLWQKHNILVHQMKEQARDGSISILTHLPVASWKVIKHKHSHALKRIRFSPNDGLLDTSNDNEHSVNWKTGEHKQPTLIRKQRSSSYDAYEYEGSADIGDDQEYSGDDDYDVDENGEDDNSTPIITKTPASNETSINNIDSDDTLLIRNYDVFNTPEQNPNKTSNTDSLESSTMMISITEPSLRTSSIDFDMDTVVTNNASETGDIMFEVSSPAINTSSIESATTLRSSSIVGITTEIVPFTMPMNWPPQIQHRTKKVPVTAGKAFSYIIPEDLFIDREDGTNLKLAMYDAEHAPLKASSWVQFNPLKREVYGLPLEEHVSKWEYIVEATDSSGASANDTLEITVQQHKGRRTVNHEFSLKLKIEKKYSSVVDWQTRILVGLVNLFRDTDMDQITVRTVDVDSDPVEFVWTNDTLPRNYCPKNDIDRLMGILQANSDGDPSSSLISAMSPELRVMSVAWHGTAACQAPPTTPDAPPPPNHADNYSPMPRNQIDQVDATVGKLLVYKVPDDTFYDPEDGSARGLKMWLTKGDRSPIPGDNWLQFDSKNQEFYGIPLERDKGRRDYQLVCEDSGGLTANDGLIVEVHSGPPFHPSFEFKMAIENLRGPLMQSAASKRKFVEKLYHLFDDKDASSIKIKSISDSPIVITWYNVSLPTDRCPHEEIKQLKNVLIKENEGSLNSRVDEMMGPEFTVHSISFDFKGVCAVGTPVHAVPEVPPPNIPGPNEEKVGSDDYIITFIIPIVVIVCMIIIAALIACILYRRRRSGKMSVGDDEERQAFRSKGIPVIFQDELDEKPDPSNKTPVIMKEEKPPLLPPPEYKEINSSSPTPSHTPYHPPPPFTASRDNARNSRPKPTPTYRKPPPYVPP